MKYYTTRCESKENLHEVLWCKIAQVFPLTSASSSSDVGGRQNVTSRAIACNVRGDGVFHCVTGQLCVNASVLCNGHTDCPDASDEETALCDERSNRANVIVFIVIVLVVMVTLAAVCWLGSKIVDCLSHIYKYCRRTRRRRRELGCFSCGGGDDEQPSSQSPSPSSSSFDLAASTRLVRARSAFALAAAATRLHQHPQMHPHLVVVNSDGKSVASHAAYSSILLSATGSAAAATASTGLICEQTHCRCCAYAMTDLNRDVSFHLTTTASLSNLVSHQTPYTLLPLIRLGSDKGIDITTEKGAGGGRRGAGAEVLSSLPILARSRPLSCIDNLPPSYSVACGRHRVVKDAA